MSRIWFVVALGIAFLVAGTWTYSEQNLKLSAVLAKPLSRLVTGRLSGETGNISLILTGDVMLGRTVESHSIDKMKDPNWPFRLVADTLKEADLVFVNLENPIVENCPRHSAGFKFCANPVMIQGLTFAGVDVANLANNHTLNYGQTGLDQTVGYLKQAGIETTGWGPHNLITKVLKGTKYGFLGFDLVDRKLSEKDLDLVRNSNDQVDLLLVAVHWGAEYTAIPNTRQKEVGKKLVESGADVVVGSHPHWVQLWSTFVKTSEDEEYIEKSGVIVPGSKVVFWSLGNFIFDQMWSEKTRQGLAVKLTFNETKLEAIEEIPVYMKNWSQPEWVD